MVRQALFRPVGNGMFAVTDGQTFFCAQSSPPAWPTRFKKSNFDIGDGQVPRGSEAVMVVGRQTMCFATVDWDQARGNYFAPIDYQVSSRSISPLSAPNRPPRRASPSLRCLIILNNMQGVVLFVACTVPTTRSVRTVRTLPKFITYATLVIRDRLNGWAVALRCTPHSNLVSGSSRTKKWLAICAGMPRPDDDTSNLPGGGSRGVTESGTKRFLVLTRGRSLSSPVTLPGDEMNRLPMQKKAPDAVPPPQKKTTPLVALALVLALARRFAFGDPNGSSRIALSDPHPEDGIVLACRTPTDPPSTTVEYYRTNWVKNTLSQTKMR